MNYKVKLHPKVDKFLTKLHPEVEDRIRQKLRLLKIDPFHYLEHFERESCYKLRIGDYRALIDIDKNLIFVRVIDHRSRIYSR